MFTHVSHLVSTKKWRKCNQEVLPFNRLACMIPFCCRASDHPSDVIMTWAQLYHLEHSKMDGFGFGGWEYLGVDGNITKWILFDTSVSTFWICNLAVLSTSHLFWLSSWKVSNQIKRNQYCTKFYIKTIVPFLEKWLKNELDSFAGPTPYFPHKRSHFPKRRPRCEGTTSPQG